MAYDDFEAEREANIARNKALIASLCIATNEVIVSKKKRAPKPQAAKAAKRKADAIEEDEDEDGNEKRAAKVVAVQADGETTGVRRSGRNAGKKVDYVGDGEDLGRRTGPRVVSKAAQKAAAAEREPKSVLNRKYDP